MRFRELLNEENVDYDSMIQSFIRLFNKHGIPLETRYLNVDAEGNRRPWTLKNASPRSEMAPVGNLRKKLLWSKEFLKRKDRIIWYMRIARILIINDIVGNESQHNGRSDDNAPVLAAVLKIRDEALRDYKHVTGHDFPTYRRLGLGGKYGNPELHFVNENALRHFASLDDLSHEVEKIRWINQSPIELLKQLDAAQTVWQKRMREKKRYVQEEPGDRNVIVFPDGFRWMLLDRHRCDAEGASMGHCGNAGSGDKSERILSLRHMTKKGLEPCATFILQKDGMLGEMKGRNNDKPIEKYHPYIVALLKLPLIKGISGGGYRPQNNFALSDLPAGEREALLAEKPSLGSE